METIITEFDLKIRYQIYRWFADHCRAPSYQEVAYLLNAEKENAETWCAEMKMPVGELLPVEQVWELSKLWYQDRLSPEFTGRTIAQAHQIFEKLDLKTKFWRFDV